MTTQRVREGGITVVCAGSCEIMLFENGAMGALLAARREVVRLGRSQDKWSWPATPAHVKTVEGGGVEAAPCGSRWELIRRHG